MNYPLSTLNDRYQPHLNINNTLVIPIWPSLNVHDGSSPVFSKYDTIQLLLLLPFSIAVKVVTAEPHSAQSI